MVGVVIGLVSWDLGVFVAVRVECPDRVGVVSRALVAGYVYLHFPGLAAVERLEETEQVVVALGADRPLRAADEVLGVRGVDADIGLGVVLHQHRLRRRVACIAAGLGRVGRGAGVLAGRRGRAARARPGVAVGRAQIAEIWILRAVAADPLGRGEDVRTAVDGPAV